MNTISSLEYFRFTIGGYSSSKFEIRLRNKTASYSADLYRNMFDLNHKKEISQKKLKDFILKINELDLLSWKNIYDSDICDGTQWELRMSYNGSEKKKIYGSNSYPGSQVDSCSRTPEFENLLTIIKELIEDPHFFEDSFIEKNEQNNLS